MPIKARCDHCGTEYILPDGSPVGDGPCLLCRMPLRRIEEPRPVRRYASWREAPRASALPLVSLILGMLCVGHVALLLLFGAGVISAVSVLVVVAATMAMGTAAVVRRLLLGRTAGGLAPAVLGLFLGLSAFAAVMVVETLTPARRRHEEACRRNLYRIGKALWAYAAQNDHYWPYDARGPLHSLALLYPAYVDDPGLFVCPAVGPKETRIFPAGCSLAGRPCSYGYDSEGHFRRMRPASPRMADRPGNHSRGFNVLHWDGHVAFYGTPRDFTDPQDNLFAPDPHLTPDVDAYIRR